MRLKAPVYIPLASLKDFGRLACALERAPIPSFALTVGGKQVLAAQLDIMNGRPVIYFAEAKVGNSQYLAYRASNGVEEVTLADFVGNPTYVYSPILNVEKFPPTLAKFGKVEKGGGYTVIKLKDMASLAKVAAYKTIYEEAPLPLFLVKHHNNNKAAIIGTTMSVNENDSLSYFYYVLLPSEPAEPFLRYASQRPEQPAFCTSLDEHGYIYLKVIRLAADHPLVKAYD